MNYTIKIVDISDPVIDLALRNLVKVVYNSPDILPEKYLAANLRSNASRPALFLVAEENNEIIGCTGFLANDFLLNGISYVGYQCTWAVTHPAYQGKKVFTTIINEAKKILEAKGSGFLFAISNIRTSHTFVNKLDFEVVPSSYVRIPNIPFFRRVYFTKSKLQNYSDTCIINEKQVMEHKATQSPSWVKVIRINDSWAWGKLAIKKKFGINVPVFYVGGVHLAREKDLKELVYLVFKSQKVFFIQFFSCNTNTFNSMLRGWKRSKQVEFNFYNLNMPGFEHLNLMIGPLDVF